MDRQARPRIALPMSQHDPNALGSTKSAPSGSQWNNTTNKSEDGPSTPWPTTTLLGRSDVDFGGVSRDVSHQNSEARSRMTPFMTPYSSFDNLSQQQQHQQQLNNNNAFGATVAPPPGSATLRFPASPNFDEDEGMGAGDDSGFLVQPIVDFQSRRRSRRRSHHCGGFDSEEYSDEESDNCTSSLTQGALSRCGMSETVSRSLMTPHVPAPQPTFTRTVSLSDCEGLGNTVNNLTESSGGFPSNGSFSSTGRFASPVNSTAAAKLTWSVSSHIGARSKQEDNFLLRPNLRVDVESTAASPTCGSEASAGCAATTDADVVHLFGVFDGHGGSIASEFLANSLEEHVVLAAQRSPDDMGQALVDALCHSDESLREAHSETNQAKTCGSTACVAVVRGNELTVANLGDSRAMLAFNSNREVIPLSVDHKPATHNGERERLTELNALMHDRVRGDLAVSRAVGDFGYKQAEEPCDQIVSNVADIHTVHLDRDVRFLLIASDGLWDVMDERQCESFVNDETSCIPGFGRGSFRNPPKKTTSAATPSCCLSQAELSQQLEEAEGDGGSTPRGLLQRPVDELVKHAVLDLNSKDNVTAMLLAFQWS